MGQFRWDSARTAQLVIDYQTQSVEAIARKMGVGVRVVAHKAARLGLWAQLPPEEQQRRKAVILADMQARSLERRAERGQFVWTPDRLAELRRLYLVEGFSPAGAAAVVGCRVGDVRRKVSQLGWVDLRPPERRIAERKAGRLAGVALVAQQRAAERRAPAERAGAERQAGDADLVAAFIAAGKVTQLPTGHACGITRWEAALAPARAPAGLSAQRRRQRDSARISAAEKAHQFAVGAL